MTVSSLPQHAQFGSSMVCSDDGSVSSTFDAIDCPAYLKNVVAHEPTHNIRPTVRFNEEANQYHNNTQWTKKDAKHMWIRDYKELKATNMQEAKAVIKAERRNKSAQSFVPVMERIYAAFCMEQEPTDADKAQLVHLLRADIRKLGMERIMIKSIRENKKLRRGELLDAIMCIQDEPCDGQNEMLMASVSQDISHPARQMAALLAQCQAEA